MGWQRSYFCLVHSLLKTVLETGDRSNLDTGVSGSRVCFFEWCIRPVDVAAIGSSLKQAHRISFIHIVPLFFPKSRMRKKDMAQDVRLSPRCWRNPVLGSWTKFLQVTDLAFVQTLPNLEGEVQKWFRSASKRCSGHKAVCMVAA